MAAKKGQPPQLPKSKSAARSNSGPADARSAEPVRDEDRVPVEIEDLATQRKHNADKPSEHGREGATEPPEGEHFEPASHDAAGSSVSEANENDKTGPAPGPGEEHVRDAWIHGKPLLFVGEGREVWEAAGVPFEVEPDPEWIAGADTGDATLQAFAEAIAAHRNFDREVLAQPV